MLHPIGQIAFDVLLDLCPHAQFVCDPATLTIVRANRAAVSRCRRREAELVGLRIAELVPAATHSGQPILYRGRPVHLITLLVEP